MILEALNIKNFGIYNGFHSIRLSPMKKKPVVLITALNGSGKTTILTAIQLILYGKLAPAVRDSKKNYHQFLKNKINNASAGETSLELDISVSVNGRRPRYSINRSWEYNCDRTDIIESFAVKMNGIEEKILSEKWLEFIEGLLPLNIMPLFFFDGEKVEEMAALENSSTMLGTGILSLLGMDIVSKLQDDLKLYENRHKITDTGNPDLSVLIDYRENVITCRGELKKLIQERASLQSKLEYTKGRLERAENKFLQSGGELYNKKEELMNKKEYITMQLDQYRERKYYIMTREGPFLLVNKLFSSLMKQAKKELTGNEAKIAGKYLAQQHKELLSLLDTDLTEEATAKINRYFNEKQEKFLKESSIEYYLNLSHPAYARLLHLKNDVLPGSKKALSKIKQTIGGLEKEMDQVNSLLEGLPGDTQIRPILKEIGNYKNEIEEYKMKILKAEERIKIARFHLKDAARRLKELIGKNKAAKLHKAKNDRILKHSRLVQEFLIRFKEKVTLHYITALEEQIKNCFHKLMHKKGFIKSVKIDSESFCLSLLHTNGEIIEPESLSAGERQLLATAIFWALTIESGIEAPVIIDTPLGRLDSQHRKNIVENYFPGAGKQVILLSTDQEITGNFISYLKPKMSYHYTIHINQDTLTSEIRELS